jgi:hypothetical protein
MSLESHPSSPQEIEASFWKKATGVLEGNAPYVVLYEQVPATSPESPDLIVARNAMFTELGCVKRSGVASQRTDMVNGLEYRIISHEFTPVEWPSIRAVVEDSIVTVKTASGDRQVLKNKAFLYTPHRER